MAEQTAGVMYRLVKIVRLEPIVKCPSYALEAIPHDVGQVLRFAGKTRQRPLLQDARQGTLRAPNVDNYPQLIATVLQAVAQLPHVRAVEVGDHLGREQQGLAARLCQDLFQLGGEGGDCLLWVVFHPLAAGHPVSLGPGTEHPRQGIGVVDDFALAKVKDRIDDAVL